MGRSHNLQHLRRTILDMEKTRHGRRAVPLRRWFNRRLRGGGIDQDMMHKIAARMKKQAAAADGLVLASHYVEHVGATAANIGVFEGEDNGDWTSLDDWLARQLDLPTRGANLYSGFWRGGEGEAILEPTGSCIISSMGDGNCYYRSVGVAMALFFPDQLRALLQPLVYAEVVDLVSDNPIAFEQSMQGLSARYPPLADAEERTEWNAHHQELMQELNTDSTIIVAWINPRLDVALVRAMRELTARQMESMPPCGMRGGEKNEWRDDMVVGDERIGGPSPDAGSLCSTVIVDHARYIRHIVRQMWVDALPCCYTALQAALSVPVYVYQTPPPCDTLPHGMGVRLYHHGLHYDILTLPWECNVCTMHNEAKHVLCVSCLQGNRPPPSGVMENA